MKEPSQILAGLIAMVQEEGGEWFATAKDFQFYGLALELATGPPCDPRTLTGAARLRRYRTGICARLHYGCSLVG